MKGLSDRANAMRARIKRTPFGTGKRKGQPYPGKTPSRPPS